FLYCRALEDRPDSPDDWRRALRILDVLTRSGPVPVLAAMRNRLGAKLGLNAPSSPQVSTRSPAPLATLLVNQYLLGEELLLESDSGTQHTLQAPGGPTNPGSNREAKGREARDRTRSSAEQALEHYRNLLAHHPDSYWGHFRAAVMTFSLGG